MSKITVDNLTFGYDGNEELVFDQVTFSFDSTWKLGLIGRNGKGKTTLLKLLQNTYPFRGKIQGDCLFEYFPFSFDSLLKDSLSIAETLNPEMEAWEFIRELNLLELKEDILDRPFQYLSPGEQTKVLLAILFLKPNAFFLIDEPTNHLDLEGRLAVSRYLRTKKGFLLVSHDRIFLDSCVDHILAINRNNIDIQKGNFSSWWDNKIKQDQFEENQNQKLNRDIQRLTQSAQQTKEKAHSIERSKIGFDPQKTEKSPGRRAFIGKKSEKIMKQSQQVVARKTKAIDEKQSLFKNREKIEDLKVATLDYSSSRLISFDKVKLFYQKDEHSNPIFITPEINFEIKPGDRVALDGKNGSGKSSILKLILGDSEVRYQGNFYQNKNLQISYIPQDTSELQGSLSDFVRQNQLELPLFRAILNKMDFPSYQWEQNMKNFSAGQKKKIFIAQSLCKPAHLLVWDEPLNYIDVFSRIQIQTLLETYKPSILFVEHDQAFRSQIATTNLIVS